MPAPPDVEEDLAPTERRYSAVKFDEWKAPTDEDFYWVVGEFDEPADMPAVSVGRGESLVVYDAEGTCIKSWDGPDDPIDHDVPEF